jgi:DNA adenine methylase
VILHNCVFSRYVEPFLGGGAVFFALAPPFSTLSDINPDLMNVYRQVRWRPHRILDELRKLDVDRATYLTLRQAVPDETLNIAVRFLYLNRTSFGGIYRTNQRGKFNVPFGGSDRLKALTQSGLLLSASKALKGSDLLTSDFEPVIDAAGEGDMVLCDPAYSVLHNDNGFVRYNESVFSWSDQRRLAAAAQRACLRGALVVVCNADHAAVRNLYTQSTVLCLIRQSRLSPVREFRRLTTEGLYLLAPTRLARQVRSNLAVPSTVSSYGVRRFEAAVQTHVDASGFVGFGVKRKDRG